MRCYGSYMLDISSYGTQGTQITITRKCRVSAVVAVMTLGFSAVYVYLFRQDSWTYQNYVLVAIAFLAVMYIIQLMSRIQKETLLILSSLGVTVKRNSLLSSTTRYFDMQHIEDIVIIEAISLHSVICQLVLLPKPLNACDKKEGKLYPLFQTFQPSLGDLKTIYRHIHTKLFPDSTLQAR